MFKFYEVGGRIRDEILGLESNDYDYVAVPNQISLDLNILFETLFLYLEHSGFKVFLATKSCFTIRARFPKGSANEGITADFVLARKELGYKPGTREPIVVVGNLHDDLARRDFTVNAIARDEEGEIYDPFKGLMDLEARILNTPISGDVTFSSDPLRILRAIRFAVTKNFTISDQIDKYIKSLDYNKLFYVVSEERIREELNKCFKHDTLKTLALLSEYEHLEYYIFSKTNLWLKPTTEK